MRNNGLRVLFPSPFLFGALTVLVVWLVGVFILERLSNFLVTVGLLVSSQKEHFITMPLADTGMTLRTIASLFGVMLVVGGVAYFLSLITRHDPDMDEAPPPPARDSLPSHDPMMGGFGADPYGMPMGGIPPMGGMQMGGGLGTGIPPRF